jgi:hypothetical protein
MSFRIATFVNDEALYAGMRRSFEDAGFVEPVTTYEVLSDSTEEPYAAISRLCEAEERYVILVHQDVRCDHGYRVSDLLARLDELTGIDPCWAIAGNVGRTRRGEPVDHIEGLGRIVWSDDLPRRVVSLDENFLVLRTNRKPHTSPELDGWHLYGTDVVLNAEADGSSAYVIDFRLSHLGAGNMVGYEEAERRLVEHWQRRFAFRYLRSSCGLAFLSRFRPIRALFGHPHVIWRLNRRFERRHLGQT